MSSWQYKYFITVEPSTRAFVYINTGGKIETHFRNHDLFKISTTNLQNKGDVECLCTGMWHKLGPSLAYWTDYARVSQKKDCSRYSASYWPVSVEGSIFRRRRDVFPWHSMRIFCLIICIVLCWVKWLCQRRGVCAHFPNTINSQWRTTSVQTTEAYTTMSINIAQGQSLIRCQSRE